MEDIIFLIYLYWDIPPADVHSEMDVNGTASLPRQIHYKALTSLGVLYIEICFGRSISKWRTTEDTAVNGGIDELDYGYTPLATYRHAKRVKIW